MYRDTNDPVDMVRMYDRIEATIGFPIMPGPVCLCSTSENSARLYQQWYNPNTGMRVWVRVPTVGWIPGIVIE